MNWSLQRLSLTKNKMQATRSIRKMWIFRRSTWMMQITRDPSEIYMNKSEGLEEKLCAFVATYE